MNQSPYIGLTAAPHPAFLPAGGVWLCLFATLEYFISVHKHSGVDVLFISNSCCYLSNNSKASVRRTYPGICDFKLSQDVLRHVVLSHRVHDKVLVACRALSGPVLMALFLGERERVHTSEPLMHISRIAQHCTEIQYMSNLLWVDSYLYFKLYNFRSS